MKKFGHKIKIFYLNCILSNSTQVMNLLRKSEYDFEIQRATSVNEFNRKVLDYKPELIVADHSIQSECLMEALEALKQTGTNIPVILVTDFESEEFAQILLKAGVTDYVFIEKPDRLPIAITSTIETQRSLLHAKSQIEYSKREFADLVQNLPMGLSIWNSQKQLVYFNRALLEFSINEDNEVYHPWKKVALDIYDNINNPFSLDGQVLTPCLTDGTIVIKDDLHVLRADGSKRYVTILAAPSRNAVGKVTSINVIFFDGTAQKMIQMKNRVLVDLIQAKNNELSQFAHIISHNLREPIAKILGLASICDTSTEDSKFIVRKITEEANRLDSVVKDLNVIVSVRNVEKEKKESLKFDHEFSLVTQVLKREIQDSQAMIEADFSDQKEIFTVKSYLYSVLYNLLSNSIKYRDLNKPLSIKMRTYRIGQYSCLSVKDNGSGIDLNKNREKIFGLYRRFHSENIPGKGVGLHFIKSYAEALGGKVEIDSQLHQGTELKVYFLNHNHNNHDAE
jgi:signal transduction histidine kinase